jgi:hypothetical protein
MRVADFIQLFLPLLGLAALISLVKLVQVIHCLECSAVMGVMLGYFLKKFSVFDRELRHGTLIFAHLAYEIYVVVGVGALYEF